MTALSRQMQGIILSVLLPGLALADMPLRVTAVTATLSDAEIEVPVTGLVEAVDLFSAASPYGGQVIGVAVEAGAVVAKGDLLAEMAPTQARESLRAAEAALAGAEATLARTTREVTRDRQLNQSGYLAQAPLDQSEEALVAARAARDQARASAETARKALADMRLIADRPALVLRRNAEPGQVVSAAQSIVDLAGLEAREAVFIASSDLDLRGQLNRKIALRSVEPPLRQLEAEISYIAPMIDSGTGGLMVKARLEPDQGAALMLQEPIEGLIPVPLGRAIELPALALGSDLEGPAVWVIGADNSVSQKSIAILHYSSDRVFVASGIAEGDRVVVKGANLLYPGRKVEVVADPPAQIEGKQ